MRHAAQGAHFHPRHAFSPRLVHQHGSLAEELLDGRLVRLDLKPHSAQLTADLVKLAHSVTIAERGLQGRLSGFQPGAAGLELKRAGGVSAGSLTLSVCAVDSPLAEYQHHRLKPRSNTAATSAASEHRGNAYGTTGAISPIRIQHRGRGRGRGVGTTHSVGDRFSLCRLQATPIRCDGRWLIRRRPDRYPGECLLVRTHSPGNPKGALDQLAAPSTARLTYSPDENENTCSDPSSVSTVIVTASSAKGSSSTSTTR